jgi:hypothetical protein
VRDCDDRMMIMVVMNVRKVNKSFIKELVTVGVVM